jgi:hypothetical protein
VGRIGKDQVSPLTLHERGKRFAFSGVTADEKIAGRAEIARED